MAHHLTIFVHPVSKMFKLDGRPSFILQTWSLHGKSLMKRSGPVSCMHNIYKQGPRELLRKLQAFWGENCKWFHFTIKLSLRTNMQLVEVSLLMTARAHLLLGKINKCKNVHMASWLLNDWVGLHTCKNIHTQHWQLSLPVAPVTAVCCCPLWPSVKWNMQPTTRINPPNTMRCVWYEWVNEGIEEICVSRSWQPLTLHSGTKERWTGKKGWHGGHGK